MTITCKVAVTQSSLFCNMKMLFYVKMSQFCEVWDFKTISKQNKRLQRKFTVEVLDFRTESWNYMKLTILQLLQFYQYFVNILVQI